MLNANVAFLSMQEWSIHQNLNRLPMLVASYISTASNIASIVMGLLLIKQTSSKIQGKDGNKVVSTIVKLPIV